MRDARTRSRGQRLDPSRQQAQRGDNAHHMVEACFKAVARALRQACAREGAVLPSSKGLL